MLLKAIFAGFGGQGVLSMGLILAQAAMLEGKNVTYLPSYGAEVRGGTANCTIAISDEDIASPIASSPEFIIVMNQPSLVRFQNLLQSGGLLFINSSLIETKIIRGDIDTISVPANNIAEDLGNPKSTNMVMLGVFTRKSNLVTFPSIITAMKDILKSKKRLIDLNKKALTTGYSYLD